METTFFITILVGVFALLGLIALLASKDQTAVVSGPDANGTDPVHRDRLSLVGSGVGKPSSQDERKERLRERLIQAGLYKKNSKPFFFFVQFLLASIPFAVAFVAYSAGLISLKYGALMALITGISGVVFPGLWLDYCKIKRQTKLRRALPDALDIITVCVEAGLSLNSALIRVSQELKTAHKMLANEMTIVHREVQMGKSPGKALKSMAQRFDVEELRSLASVIEQSERFGASITAALRVYAQSLRERRMQEAQMRAQKAAVKLLFPTIIFIFPALLIVTLGPAAFDIYEILISTK